MSNTNQAAGGGTTGTAPTPPTVLTLVQRTAVTRKVEVPARGGVDTFPTGDIAWTGGNPYDKNVTSPAANGCYRPMEPDKARKVEDKCLQPLPETRRLAPISTKTGQKQVPLIQWMKDVQAHLITNGMDGVFYAVNAKTNTELSLLEQWSKTTIHEVAEWIKVEPWDFYDMDNLRMSGKFLRDSISDDLYERIKFAIQGNEVGPLIYVAVVQDMQQIGTVAARMIVDEVRKLHIKDIPGEDVKALTNTLFEYCSRLEGVQAVPFDLAGIVAACFLKSATLAFNIEMNTINRQAQLNQITWSQVLTLVGTEYQTLLGNGQWEASIIAPETTQSALKAEIRNEVLQELRRTEVKPTGSGTPPSSNQDVKRINPNIICNKCKERGHIARDCVKSGGGGNQTQTTNPYRIKPKDGETQVKSINGIECSWCDRCNRWTSGNKRHSTTEHKTRSELQGGAGLQGSMEGGSPSSTPAGNLAAGLFGGGLTMTHFHGAGHA